VFEHKKYIVLASVWQRKVDYSIHILENLCSFIHSLIYSIADTKSMAIIYIQLKTKIQLKQ